MKVMTDEGDDDDGDDEEDEATKTFITNDTGYSEHYSSYSRDLPPR